MEGAAPKEIIQSVDQSTEDLHTGVSQKLTEAGHPVTAAEVNPDDRSSLERIRETMGNMTKDPVRVMGGIVEEYIGGDSPTTHVGSTESRTPISIAARRLVQKGKGFLKERHNSPK